MPTTRSNGQDGVKADMIVPMVTVRGDEAERGSDGLRSILVTGVAGQLGRQLRTRGGSRVRGLTSAQLDITDPVSVYQAVGKLGPGDVVINCAAYTAVDNAESDRSTAGAVNADGPGYLAEHTARTGAHLIHISTDYVFTGSSSRPLEPGDPTGPESVYGATKLAGEQAVRAADPAATIVRTAWVYTGAVDSADFVGTMRRLERDRDTVSVVTDQVGSPTFSGDLAEGLLELAGEVSGPESVASGQILHATNAGSCSWFDLTQALFAELGADPSRVLPTTTANFPRPAPRPAYSVLSGRAWQEAGLTPLRDWRAALTAAVRSDG
jgi:dTDP-4-dehydrorhamnose reductase